MSQTLAIQYMLCPGLIENPQHVVSVQITQSNMTKSLGTHGVMSHALQRTYGQFSTP